MNIFEIQEIFAEFRYSFFYESSNATVPSTGLNFRNFNTVCYIRQACFQEF
jgi:hypothetical protein